MLSQLSIPPAMTPFYWEVASVNESCTNIHQQIQKYSQWLPIRCKIDEASVLVPAIADALDLADQLKACGWDQFNEAKDLVYTNPFGTHYRVNYWFFESPNWNWRLEVMHLPAGQGFSPLHQSLWKGGTRPSSDGMARRFPMPHLSFKADGVGGMPIQRAYSYACDVLQRHGLIHAQTCQSTYGAFGYYLPNDTRKQLYLKPRINLRDAVVEAVA
jgi:hypothetical protein